MKKKEDIDDDRKSLSHAAEGCSKNLWVSSWIGRIIFKKTVYAKISIDIPLDYLSCMADVILAMFFKNAIFKIFLVVGFSEFFPLAESKSLAHTRLARHRPEMSFFGSPHQIHGAKNNPTARNTISDEHVFKNRGVDLTSTNHPLIFFFCKFRNFWWISNVSSSFFWR